MHDKHGYTYRTLNPWEILALRRLILISQEIISTGFKDIGSLRRKLAELQVILNKIEGLIDWEISAKENPTNQSEITPQQLSQTFNEIIEWIETNYPNLSTINF
ncbi:MAG: hypothetical protein RID09_20410 [Coleofasciculus sp. G1-WW12-02]|uniref:hypothetical protein n=1 Tax=Coleofasciculus sp. G1-WW12-02 TaxID=3068483 RepID=UPI0032F878CC